jgi:hypothetical protein
MFRGRAGGRVEDDEQPIQAGTAKKCPPYNRTKGALYGDWKIDVHLWKDGLPANTTPAQLVSYVYVALEENEKSILRHKGTMNDGKLQLTFDEILRVLDKEIGKDQLAQSWLAYQNWKKCRWRD